MVGKGSIMSRQKAWVPPVVGQVTRTRNVTSRDPDAPWMETEHHFEQAADGRYDRVDHTEEYSVDVVRLPCGHDVPQDELGVEFDPDPFMDGFLEQMMDSGAVAMVVPCSNEPFDPGYNTACPRCGVKHRVTDSSALDLEETLRHVTSPRAGWL